MRLQRRLEVFRKEAMKKWRWGLALGALCAVSTNASDRYIWPQTISLNGHLSDKPTSRTSDGGSDSSAHIESRVVCWTAKDANESRRLPGRVLLADRIHRCQRLLVKMVDHERFHRPFRLGDFESNFLDCRHESLDEITANIFSGQPHRRFEIVIPA